MKKDAFYHALKVVSTACTGCTHCMHVCPTSAIRIKHGKAVIDEAACTDCGMCLKSCPQHAIIVAQDDFAEILRFPFRVILLPTVFIGQFGEDITEEQIFAELHNLGFDYVIEVDKATGLLLEGTKRYMAEHPEQRPFISNFCPAIVRLIQVRFPSLIPHIIRLKQAMDITAAYVRKKYIDLGIPEKDIGVFYQYGRHTPALMTYPNSHSGFLLDYDAFLQSSHKFILSNDKTEWIGPNGDNLSKTLWEKENLSKYSPLPKGWTLPNSNTFINWLSQQEKETVTTTDGFALVIKDKEGNDVQTFYGNSQVNSRNGTITVDTYEIHYYGTSPNVIQIDKRGTATLGNFEYRAQGYCIRPVKE